MASNKSTQELSGLGSLDYSSVSEAVANSSGSKRNYQKWTDKQRFQIGKYAVENGPAAAARKFTTIQNPLKESIIFVGNKKQMKACFVCHRHCYC